MSLSDLLIELLQQICPELAGEDLAIVLEKMIPEVPEAPVAAAVADLDEMLEDDGAAIASIEAASEPFPKEALSLQAELRGAAFKLRAASTHGSSSNNVTVHWAGHMEQAWDPEASCSS